MTRRQLEVLARYVSCYTKASGAANSCSLNFVTAIEWRHIGYPVQCFNGWLTSSRLNIEITGSKVVVENACRRSHIIGWGHCAHTKTFR